MSTIITFLSSETALLATETNDFILKIKIKVAICSDWMF